jgi:tryptophan synthase alpha chain
MNRIASVFARPGHKALIAYLTVGYPSPGTAREIVPALAEWGCDMVELGIPFSDPLADGATIQEASYQALRQGVTPEMCLETAAALRRQVDIPLLFMSYYNPIFSLGLEPFCQSCAEAGVDGLIIPDLPPEEAGELETAASRSGLDLIYFLAPTSTESRIKLVAEKARGFIYLVSLTGVTGARKALPPELEEFVSRVRKLTFQPLCLGFGIGTAEQAQRAARVADGVIVGSRIVELVGENPPTALQAFIRKLRAALDSLES